MPQVFTELDHFLLNAPLLAGVFPGYFAAPTLRRSFRPICYWLRASGHHSAGETLKLLNLLRIDRDSCNNSSEADVVTAQAG